jgi:hypothetical protein
MAGNGLLTRHILPGNIQQWNFNLEKILWATSQFAARKPAGKKQTDQDQVHSKDD